MTLYLPFFKLRLVNLALTSGQYYNRVTIVATIVIQIS